MSTPAPFQPTGTHLLADFHGVDATTLADGAALERLLLAAARAAGARVLSAHFHGFGDGCGVTGVVLLAESHISLHTWPEAGFAAADIFMCGAAQPRRALETLREGFAARDCQVRVVGRGTVTRAPTPYGG